MIKCDSFDARYDTRLAISAVVPLYPSALFVETWNVRRFEVELKSHFMSTFSFQSPVDVVPGEFSTTEASISLTRSMTIINKESDQYRVSMAYEEVFRSPQARKCSR